MKMKWKVCFIVEDGISIEVIVRASKKQEAYAIAFSLLREGIQVHDMCAKTYTGIAPEMRDTTGKNR